jgi:uncharacterized membrane-anchored protein YhcB (DUF1043 family)
MTYLRIDRNKFWGWVVVSLLVGLAIGFGTMFLLTSSSSNEVRTLNNRVGSVHAQLTAAETSLTALAEQNTQLTLTLEAANAQIASLQGSSSSTTTDTSTTTTTTVSLSVTSRTVTPSTVATSGTITMTAKVKGSPTKVTMRVYIKATPRTFDKTYTLKLVSTSGDTQTWRLKVAAPTKVGTYLYFATAIKGTSKVTMVGASASSFKVH